MALGANCQWKQDAEGIWQTDCGHEMCLPDDGNVPSDLHMSWCCFCGGTLVEAPFDLEDDDAEAI